MSFKIIPSFRVNKISDNDLFIVQNFVKDNEIQQLPAFVISSKNNFLSALDSMRTLNLFAKIMHVE